VRQVLVDTARAQATAKRGEAKELPLTELRSQLPSPNRSVLAIDDVLRDLERSDPLKVRLIEMRYFGGMTAKESSVAVSKPIHVVRRELRLAEAWLRKEMAAKDRAKADWPYESAG
jgi:DNA-directed RNA polymerase specialized sigma24 family protein